MNHQCSRCGLRHVDPCNQSNGRPTQNQSLFVAFQGFTECVKDNNFVVPLFINNQSCIGLRDSGSNITIVKRDLVPVRAHLSGQTVEVRNFAGGRQTLLLAKVALRSSHFGTDTDFETTVALCDRLEFDLLLGNEFFKMHPEITDVIVQRAVGQILVPSDDRIIENTHKMEPVCNRVTTRS
jgi:hypothetical protein